MEHDCSRLHAFFSASFSIFFRAIQFNFLDSCLLFNSLLIEQQNLILAPCNFLERRENGEVVIEVLSRNQLCGHLGKEDFPKVGKLG